MKSVSSFYGMMIWLVHCENAEHMPSFAYLKPISSKMFFVIFLSPVFNQVHKGAPGLKNYLILDSHSLILSLCYSHCFSITN